MPGDSLNINVVLVNKVPLSVGLRFVMREGNLTIGAELSRNYLSLACLRLKIDI